MWEFRLDPKFKSLGQHRSGGGFQPGQQTSINSTTKVKSCIRCYSRTAKPDAQSPNSSEFGPSEPIKLSCRPFKWVEENGIDPKCLVYLTDLCCHSFPDAPEYPVLWVTDSPKTATFGETLRIRIVG
jgi:hypothetical protein